MIMTGKPDLWKQTCSMRTAGKFYCAPMIGNGDIAMQVGFEGAQTETAYCNMASGIVRAGFRHNSAPFELIRFGFLGQEIAGAGTPEDWTQTLDSYHGIVTTDCLYPDGLHCETTAFCHLERCIVVLHKKFSRPARVSMEFSHPAHRRVLMTPESDRVLKYDIDGLENYLGWILLDTDIDNAQGSSSSTGIKLSADCTEATFVLAFGKADETVLHDWDYDELLRTHCAAWEKFHAESMLEIPSEKLLRMYRTAVYTLRIFSTKWSIPTGLHPALWEGRYFGYDELYCFDALLSCGHLNLAKKVPSFRYDVLNAAIARVSETLDKSNKVPVAAQYPWETLENGSEGAPPGYWCDHLFHHAHIGLAAAWYARYSGDREFLRSKAYPVIRACTELFRAGHLYKDEQGKWMVGKCADLELLGTFRENAFATTCSVVSLFREAAHAAQILGTDKELAEEWLHLADELFANLPNDGQKYLPYPNCRQRSITAFFALYPYNITRPGDPLLDATLRDTEEHAADFAVQYARGGSVMTTWYAGIIALSHIRCGRTADAVRVLEDTAQYAGCFAECFEVYEWQLKPWFATAAGAIVRAVNALMQEDGRLTAGIEKIWPDFQFRLQGLDGDKVAGICRGGICKLEIEKNSGR